VQRANCFEEAYARAEIQNGLCLVLGEEIESELDGG